MGVTITIKGKEDLEKAVRNRKRDHYNQGKEIQSLYFAFRKFPSDRKV